MQSAHDPRISPVFRYHDAVRAIEWLSSAHGFVLKEIHKNSDGQVVHAELRLGSAAIDLCYVAAGRMDGFWERDLKPWDIAGGALIVEEAGGRVTNMEGSPFSSRGLDVLATNGRLHDAMLDVVRTFHNDCRP